jgi:hypothetical protein
VAGWWRESHNQTRATNATGKFTLAACRPLHLHPLKQQIIEEQTQARVLKFQFGFSLGQGARFKPLLRKRSAVPMTNKCWPSWERLGPYRVIPTYCLTGIAEGYD